MSTFHDRFKEHMDELGLPVPQGWFDDSERAQLSIGLLANGLLVLGQAATLAQLAARLRTSGGALAAWSAIQGGWYVAGAAGACVVASGGGFKEWIWPDKTGSPLWHKDTQDRIVSWSGLVRVRYRRQGDTALDGQASLVMQGEKDAARCHTALKRIQKKKRTGDDTTTSSDWFGESDTSERVSVILNGDALTYRVVYPSYFSAQGDGTCHLEASGVATESKMHGWSFGFNCSGFGDGSLGISTPAVIGGKSSTDSEGGVEITSWSLFPVFK